GMSVSVGVTDGGEDGLGENYLHITATETGPELMDGEDVSGFDEKAA
ncbi:unnamed protein product, partial [marine sediment metagenome]